MVAEVRQSVPTFARETPVSFSLAMASSVGRIRRRAASAAPRGMWGTAARSVQGNVQGAIAMFDAGASASTAATAMATTGGEVEKPPGLVAGVGSDEEEPSRAKRFFVGEPVTPPPGSQVEELRQYMKQQFEIIGQRVQQLGKDAHETYKGCGNHMARIGHLEEYMNTQNIHESGTVMARVEKIEGAIKMHNLYEGDPIKMIMDNRHAATVEELFNLKHALLKNK